MKITVSVTLFLFTIIANFSCASVFAVEYTGREYPDPFFKSSIGQASPRASEEISDPRGNQAQADFVLEGIVWSSGRPRAIINGQVVQKGSNIAQAEVVNIEKNSVTIRYNGKDVLLRSREI